MKRRSFLAGILVASVSPAIVRAASLMPVKVMDSGLLVPAKVVILLSNVILMPLDRSHIARWSGFEPDGRPTVQLYDQSDKQVDGSWSGVVVGYVAAINAELKITNYLTQVRGPLQAMKNAGLIRRTADVHSETYQAVA